MRTKPLPFLALLVLGLSTLFGGCNSTTKPDSVVVSVADLKAADATLMETHVVITLRFTSESLNAFGFSGSTHKLYLNGAYVGKAVNNKPVGLPPLSTVTQDVTLILENAALVKQLLAMQGGLVAKYRLDSTLFSTAGEDEMRVKGTFEGTLDLRSVQAAQ